MRAIKKCAVLLLAIIALVQATSTAFASSELLHTQNQLMLSGIFQIPCDDDEWEIIIADDEWEIIIAEVYAPAPGLQSAATTITGVIKDIISYENMYNILVSVVDNGNDDVILKVFKDTAIIDNVSKKRLNISELKEGEVIVAFVSNAMTMSLPPQVNAHAIISNIRQDGPVARYMTVAEVKKTDEGKKQVLSEDGAYLITISDETTFLPYKEDQKVGHENVLVGKRMFAWFEVSALSAPSEAVADYVVILPAIEETEIVTTKEEEYTEQYEECAEQYEGFTTQLKGIGSKLSYDNFDRIGVMGNIIALYDTPLFVKNNEIMIPIRKVSYALGFAVDWDAERKGVSIHTGYDTFSMRIGYDEYVRECYYAEYTGHTSRTVEKFGIAPMLVGGVTYVPAALLNFIFEDNNTTAVVEGMLVVTVGNSY